MQFDIPTATMTIKDLESLPPLLTPAVVARLIDVSEDTVLRLCRSGDLPARKIGKHWRLPTERLLASVGLLEPTPSGDNTTTPADRAPANPVPRRVRKMGQPPTQPRTHGRLEVDFSDLLRS